jgi:hypothetical protein
VAADPEKNSTAAAHRWRAIEHDYPQLHPNMLYAEIGARLEGDAYAVDGWPRKLMKVAFKLSTFW